jgi:hypothetical protein
MRLTSRTVTLSWKNVGMPWHTHHTLTMSLTISWFLSRALGCEEEAIDGIPPPPPGAPDSYTSAALATSHGIDGPPALETPDLVAFMLLRCHRGRV